MMNNSTLIPIGEMARLNHTSIVTLRLYDRLGLLRPAYVNEESNYRYYDIKQNARFDMIQYMKELGMQLKEIKSILDEENLSKIESILKQKQEITKQKIEELVIQEEAINRTIEGIARYQKSPQSGTITLEYIPKRQIYEMVTDINFYDYGIDTYEYILKKLKNDLITNSLPEIYYCNAGTILKKDNFLNQNFISDRMFVFVDQHFPRPEKTTVIENGMFACIYSDSFDEEKKYAKKLFAYCQKNQYQIIGDYICEVLMEFDVFSHEERHMFLRLQVPVSFSKKS